MHAGEPDLEQVLRPVRSRGIVARPPQVGAEERAALVDRDRMTAVLDVRVIRDERQPQGFSIQPTELTVSQIPTNQGLQSRDTVRLKSRASEK